MVKILLWLSLPSLLFIYQGSGEGTTKIGKYKISEIVHFVVSIIMMRIVFDYVDFRNRLSVGLAISLIINTNLLATIVIYKDKIFELNKKANKGVYAIEISDKAAKKNKIISLLKN